MMISRSARTIASAVLSRNESADDVCSQVLDTIETLNPRLLAFRAINGELARKTARTVDERIARGERDLPLAGVPVAIKDSFAQANRANPAGRKDGAGRIETQDAELVQRLLRAGAVIVGRTNMDELAYGVTGTNPHTGQLRNPRREDYHPGGSSGGSAAAVASGMVPLAVGSDTVGSVRIPASLCGIMALRPTQKRCPSTGIAPLAPSLDVPGPMARNVSDLSLLLSVLAGDPSLEPPHETPVCDGLKVTALMGPFAVEIHHDVGSAFFSALEALESLGSKVWRQKTPLLASAPRAAGPIVGAEASHAWAKELEDHPEWFSQPTADLLRKGLTLTAVRYLKACEERERIVSFIDTLFEDADVLALPTTATPATPISNVGEQLPFLALTVPFSLADLPALTLPMGMSEGLPLGLQLVARKNQESLLLRIAGELEESLAVAS